MEGSVAQPSPLSFEECLWWSIGYIVVTSFAMDTLDTSFAMKLDIQLRCIRFQLITLEMILQLDWSPPVINLIDWT